jgi:hypothetical protein
MLQILVDPGEHPAIGVHSGPPEELLRLIRTEHRKLVRTHALVGDVVSRLEPPPAGGARRELPNAVVHRQEQLRAVDARQ